MCYAACWWARVDAIFHASTIDDAHGYGGFDDRPILDALRLPLEERPLPVTQLLRDEMLGIWREFQERDDRPHY